MPASVSENFPFLAATVCLMASAALRVARTRRRSFEEGANLLALTFTCAWLVLSCGEAGGWPATTKAEMLAATAAASMLWGVLHRHEAQPALAGVSFSALTVGLLAWSAVQRIGPVDTSAVSAPETVWLPVTHLALALACGAFLEAGALAVPCLLNRTKSRAAYDGDPTRHALLPGLPLLTLSLLLRSLGGQYTSGVSWSWTASESWQLLVWLFYTIMWMAWALRGWQGRKMQLLVVAGSALAVLMLHAWAG